MCIFANEGGPKSKSSRQETPLKIQKYKEIHVSGKNLENKMFLGMPAPTPIVHASFDDLQSLFPSLVSSSAATTSIHIDHRGRTHYVIQVQTTPIPHSEEIHGMTQCQDECRSLSGDVPKNLTLHCTMWLSIALDISKVLKSKGLVFDFDPNLIILFLTGVKP